MNSLSNHFAHHRSHLWGCGVAALLVAAAIIFQLPALALFGGLFCAAMMIGMVWMMISMARR